MRRTKIIYDSPINYAPAYLLDLCYRAQPMGPSHLHHAWGDRFEDTLGGWRLEDIAHSLNSMSVLWNGELSNYRRALAEGKCSAEQRKHREDELSCAEMIGCHLACVANIYRFHGWRLDAMERLGFEAPCEIPPDEISRQIMCEEVENTRKASGLLSNDSRLAFHQESQVFFFDVNALVAKQKNLERQLMAVHNLRLICN